MARRCPWKFVLWIIPFHGKNRFALRSDCNRPPPLPAQRTNIAWRRHSEHSRSQNCYMEFTFKNKIYIIPKEKMEPEMAPNGAKNEPKMAPKCAPKGLQKGTMNNPRKAPNPYVSLCFGSKGGSEGPPKRAPKMTAKHLRKGARS